MWTIQNGWVREALYIFLAPSSTSDESNCGWVNRYTLLLPPSFVCLLPIHVVVHIISTQNNLDLMLHSRNSMTANFIPSIYLDLRYHPLNIRSSNLSSATSNNVPIFKVRPLPHQPCSLRFICKIQWGLCWWTFRCNICLFTQQIGLLDWG